MAALNIFEQYTNKQCPLPAHILNTYSIEKGISPYPTPNIPKISIMTIHGKLCPVKERGAVSHSADNKSLTGIDVEKVFGSFLGESPELSKLHLGVRGFKFAQIQSGTNILSLENGKRTTSNTKGFPHGCSFKAKPLSEPSRVIDVKLFKKGKLQATGCKSPEEMRVLSEIVIRIIEIVEGTKYVFTDPVVSMIKSNFNANFKMDLNKLVRIIDSSYSNQITRSYSPEFRGLTLKWIAPFCKISNGKQQRVTFIVHSSGNIAMMCNNNTSNVRECWTFINQILRDNYEEIVVTRV